MTFNLPISQKTRDQTVPNHSGFRIINMKNIKLLLVIFISFFVSACATLNKSECLNADWQIIGLEDGSKGRALTYIGQHRKACAEHSVVPNLDLYQAGYEVGLAQFCTAEVGFAQGKRGYQYDGVCPAALRSDFLYGYERGRELYLLTREISHIHREIKGMDAELESMKSEINELELKLISKAGSPTERLAILQQLKELQSYSARLESDIHNLELDAARMQGEHDVLNSQHAF